MRIGFDAKRALHNFRGLGNYSRTLIEGLVHHFPREEYFLFSSPPKDERGFKWRERFDFLEFCPPSSYWSKCSPSFWRSFLLANDIEKKKIDLYHGLSHELPMGIRGTKARSLVTIHDLIFMRYPQFFPRVDRYIYRQKYLYAIKKADLIVAICEQTKRDLIDFFHIAEEKIMIVYQSCHPSFYSHSDPSIWEDLKLKFKLPPSYILSVGAIEERKNTLLLLQAFSRLKNLIPHHLVLVGDGKDYKKRVCEEIARQGLGERVLFLKNIKNQQLPDLYRHADLFVYPSFFEGWGIPNVEALFSGVPVITGQGSALEESAGPHSLFIDPTSVEDLAYKMEKLLFDQGLREKMVKEGRLYAEQFHWKKTSEKMMDVYRSLI